MKKRLLLIMLALCVMLALLPMGVFATEEMPEKSTVTVPGAEKSQVRKDVLADGASASITEPEKTLESVPLSDEAPTSGTCGENAFWKLDSDGVLTISGSGEMKHYGSVKNVPWRANDDAIKSIVIQDGITSIGDLAFDGCHNASSVSIPTSVTDIGEAAFMGCHNLENVAIPDSVLNIGDDAFDNCWKLTSVTISKSISLIGWGTFSECHNLESVTIPDGVTTIEGWAFGNCYNLANVGLPNSITTIQGSAFASCNKLTNLRLPDSITTLDTWAFNECTNLYSVNIPKGVTNLDEFAFCGCSRLSRVFIPKGIRTISPRAFGSNDMTDIYYGGSKSDWKSINIDPNNKEIFNANIHYDSTLDEMSSHQYKVYRNGGYEAFDRSVEHVARKTGSSTYNPQLAHMLIAMCNSVYESTDIMETLKNFGFKERVASYTLTGGIMLSYSMAKKQVGDRTLVLVVARGTDGMPWNDPIEWASNIHVITNDKKQHTGFADAANALYDQITNPDFLGTTDFSNVDFVITGFSRGAAATNILAARLTDETSYKNVYAYAFACPDTTVEASGYSCIFNIANSNDLVSWIPETFLKSNWDKYGKSYWYSENWDDFENLEMGMAAHNQVEYLSYLRSEKPVTEYKARSAAKSALDDAAKKRDEKFWQDVKNTFLLGCVRIHCPVDVEVYASDGALVGNVKNDIVYSMNSDKIYISILDGKKDIYLLGNDTYTFRITATDKGTMDYSVQNIRVSDQSVIEGTTFANVSLTDGKEMSSTVSFKSFSDAENDKCVDIPNVHLYILDGDGNALSEVRPGSDGVEIPIHAEEDNSGTPDNTTNKTDESNMATGKLVSVKVEKIKISGISHKIAAGKKIALKATVMPSNATNKSVTWKSSNKKYATVNSKGVVTMKKAGKGKTVTITAMAKDGSGKKASYKIKCMRGAVKKIIISGRKNQSLKAGKTMKLKTKVTASNGANKVLRWKSSNTKYATVNKNGKVTAKKAGKGKMVRIIALATDGSGKKATVKIKIR